MGRPIERLGWYALALLVSAAGVACSPDRTGSDEWNSGEARRPDPVATATMDCIREGYPCTMAEVELAVWDRQDQLVDRAVAMMAEAGPLDAVAWLQDQDGVIEAHGSDAGLMFRLDGGQPFHIVRPVGADSLPPEMDRTGLPRPGSGTHLPLPPVSRAGLSAPWSIIPRGPAVNPTAAPSAWDVVGRGTARDNPQNRKKALFLEPYARHNAGRFAEGIAELRTIPDYAHAEDDVIVLRDSQVTPETFESWRSFDAVFLATHGGFEGDQTWIATGVLVQIDGDTRRQRDICRSMNAWMDRPGVSCGVVQDGVFGAVRNYLALGLSTDFFRDAYCGSGSCEGLDKSIVYIAGCHTLSVWDLADVLAGGTSAYLGWNERIGHSSYRTNVALLRALVDLRRPVGTALEVLCLANLCVNPTHGAKLTMYPNDEAAKLRMYDVPTLRDPLSPASTGPGLQDGAHLQIKGAPGDGRNDELRIMVDMTGVIDPNDTSDGLGGIAFATAQTENPAELYQMRFLIGEAEQDIGQDNLGLALDPTATVTQLDQTTYRYTYLAELPFDVEEGGDRRKLKVVVPLPEGGESDYEVEVVLVGGCYFSFDYTGAVQSSTAYAGAVTGNARFSIAELDQPGARTDRVGGMQAFNLTAAGERVPEVTLLSLVDQDPRFSRAVLAEPGGSAIPLGVPGTFNVTGGVHLHPTQQDLIVFGGDLEVTITRSDLSHETGVPRIEAIEGTFRSAGDLGIDPSYARDYSGGVSVQGEFAFYANSCRGAML